MKTTPIHLPTPRVFCPRCRKEVRWQPDTANPPKPAVCGCRVRRVKTINFFEIRDVCRRLSFHPHHPFGVVAEGDKVLLINEQYLIALEKGWYALYSRDSREPMTFGRYTWIPNIAFLQTLLAK